MADSKENNSGRNKPQTQGNVGGDVNFGNKGGVDVKNDGNTQDGKGGNDPQVEGNISATPVRGNITATRGRWRQRHSARGGGGEIITGYDEDTKDSEHQGFGGVPKATTGTQGPKVTTGTQGSVGGTVAEPE